MLSLLNVCRFNIIATDDELRLDRELLRCESESFLSDFEGDTFALDEHHAGFDGSNESSWVTFTLTHADVGGFAGYRFVGEDTDPDLAFTLHIASDSDTCGLDLTSRDPEGSEGLDSEGTEGELGAAVGDADVFAASVLRPSIFDSLRL